MVEGEKIEGIHHSSLANEAILNRDIAEVNQPEPVQIEQTIRL